MIYSRTGLQIVFLATVVLTRVVVASDTVVPPKTGPETEKRFPPLQVPAGFKATLFACDPLIEYPSAISAGPRPNAIFVAVDYMTGLGTEIVRRSEVRLVEDTDHDGYADRASVFAAGLNSIMGLCWHDGVLYVMHAPYLTALRDTKGSGTADERIDLITGLGLTPEENPVRLHCANGVTAGHDGWLYLALGDHGCDVKRPEGDRLVLEGGGILRCRPDGRDLHIFSTGLRNIYDVALDAELNVFVRDNENDGGDYKIRVCHSFFGADHGYPYLYYEDPDEALRPLADLGLGSSAGGVCYLEPHFPPQYQGNLFFCEWGKSLVTYPLERTQSSVASKPEMEFATGAATDPYGFKPTDVVVQSDGTLMVADYADGQRPKRGRGRIYRITTADGKPAASAESVQGEPLSMLDSESYFARWQAQSSIERSGEQGLRALQAALEAGKLGVRGRSHAIWILTHAQAGDAIESLLKIAASDADPSVRAQAVRAVADLADPVLVQHRLEAKLLDPAIAVRIAELGKHADSRVALEVIIALGRLGWSDVGEWLVENLDAQDPARSHAAMQALRRSGNWKALLDILDASSRNPIRPIALRAASRQYDVGLVDGILERLGSETDPSRLTEYTRLMARVHNKPSPWVYWGYRPAPRPNHTVAWERSDAIAAGLNRLLRHPDLDVRFEVLTQMKREGIPSDVKSLAEWLGEDSDPRRVALILDGLRDPSSSEVHASLAKVIRATGNSPENRFTALALYVQGMDQAGEKELLALAESLEDGVVLAETLRLLGKHPNLDASSLLTSKIGSPLPEVRAAAVETIGQNRVPFDLGKLAILLRDRDTEVRRASALAAGKLGAAALVDSLLELVGDQDGSVRAASLSALHMLNERRAVPLAATALEDRETDLVALALLHDLGGPEQADSLIRLAEHHPSRKLIAATVAALSKWSDQATEDERKMLEQAIAEIQAKCGELLVWHFLGPIATPSDELFEKGISAINSRKVTASGPDGRVSIESTSGDTESWFIGTTLVRVQDKSEVELLLASNCRIQIWLNGQKLHERGNVAGSPTELERVGTALESGNNRLGVALQGDPSKSREFQLRFRRKSSIAEREQYTAAALGKPGDASRGRAVFLNSEKSQCAKCHRVADVGERVGPELTGVGSRFARIHVIESILEPSRSVGPSYLTSVVLLQNGQVLSGIITEKNDAHLTLVDSQGQKHVIARDAIDEWTTSMTSTMPEGLEKRLSEGEFVDLVAYLMSLVEPGQ